MSLCLKVEGRVHLKDNIDVAPAVGKTASVPTFQISVLLYDFIPKKQVILTLPLKKISLYCLL